MKNAQKGSLRISVIWLLLIFGAWGIFAFTGWCLKVSVMQAIAATRTH